jgi:hypothetical protein
MVRTLPQAAQDQFKTLMAEVRKDPLNCPLARPMKGAPGFYAPFGSHTAAYEVRVDARLIWVSHVTGIDLSRSVINERPPSSPNPPAIL